MPPPPLVSLILLTYRQSGTVEAAFQSALWQTYDRLEIIVSDDASPDDTFARIQAMASQYEGPHSLKIHQNTRNLGIGANISQAVLQSHGELIVIAAGDDVSLPERCSVLAQTWEQSGHKLDLLASWLTDMDAQGQLHGTIQPSPLEDLHHLNDWMAHRPHVVGAAQAWTRRLFDKFGPLPAGVVAEDLVMVFRAIASGGARTLPQVLVQYRRGGLSGKRKHDSPQAVVDAWLKSNRHALVEAELMLNDCIKVHAPDNIKQFFQAELARARYLARLFAPGSRSQRLLAGVKQSGMPWGKRLRYLTYAVCPELLAPFFWLKSLWR